MDFIPRFSSRPRKQETPSHPHQQPSTIQRTNDNDEEQLTTNKNKNHTDPKSLSLLVLAPVDVASAIVASTLVTPAVAIIDKAIFVSASTELSLLGAIANGTREFVTAPFRYTRTPAFRWVWGLYAGTYLAANTVQTLCERDDINPGLPKFLSSTVVNVTLSVLKDKALTTTCGKGVPHPIARTTLGLYALRDTVTVFSSFTLPPHVTRHLVNQYGITDRTAGMAAQFLAPVAAQVACAPLHLYGLDIYNNPERKPTERFRFVRRAYLSTTAFRMARIIPAFGVGGVANAEMRERGRNDLARRLANTEQGGDDVLFQKQKVYGYLSAKAETAYPNIVTGMGKLKRLIFL